MLKYIQTFESFGTSDSLYHTPHIVYFNRILQLDMLLAQQTSENTCSRDYPAVSLTRNQDLRYDDQPLQFKINRQKLAMRYKLESYVDPIYNGEDLEEEEITRESIQPLSAFLESIQFCAQPRILNLVEAGDIEDVYPVLEAYLSRNPHVKFEIVDGDGIRTATARDILEYTS